MKRKLTEGEISEIASLAKTLKSLRKQEEKIEKRIEKFQKICSHSYVQRRDKSGWYKVCLNCHNVEDLDND
jgi:chaperonin cofactor prefoldin